MIEIKSLNLKNIRKTQKGQSLVEVAISITFILILLSGVVDFGMALITYIELRDAAQEGALYGSIHPDDLAGIESRIRNSADKPVDLNDQDLVGITIDNGTACEGGALEVNVKYNYPLSMPFISTFIGSTTISLRATVTDTILTPRC